MTESEHRRHLRSALALENPGAAGTPTEHLWLLLPPGVAHDPAVLEHAARLGANGVVTGPSRHHREAAEAGHDVSGPVLYRPPPVEPVPYPPMEPDLHARIAALEALLAARP